MRKIKHKLLWGMVFIMGVLAGIFFTAKLDIMPRVGAVISTQKDDFASYSDNISEGLENAVINVAEKVGQAVVSISTEHTERVPGGVRRFYFGTPFGGNEQFGDEFFRRFFDDFFGDVPEREFKQQGLGSGVIIDGEGYILTNEHVVADADKITVTLPDGREFEGEIKGKDARADLAVIKINARDLPVARLGNSDNVKIGQWVIAIGNPFGFVLHSPEPTVTAGVVSALHRSLGRALSRDKDFTDLIQTDAAINPGNSGGPLVSLNGEVIGINVAIFSTTGGYQGVGFAIPINSAKRILDKLIAGKKILYGWLGVTVQELDDKLAEYFGLAAGTKGVLVNDVIKDGPAEKGGLKSGDIILSFEGKNISSLRELLSIVAGSEVGKKVKMDIWRDKKAKAITIEIGERPEDLDTGLTLSKPGQTDEYWRGIKVKDIDQETRRRFNLAASEEGVVVIDIEPDSSADEAVMLAGDIIDEINKAKISNVDDFKRISKDLKGDVLIRTRRGYIVMKDK
ncbi:MAG: hypothetical protein COV72_08865 [Candidatus Omnitrophica bacterium CG11_big_fil_rev_8_21_14_0_20_42_13]|uniref:PDZ domain-containing protein n=1 Tax=Candidatus Ghiorseimicrobium undicola TaxID=1974746 RepID=A0A2H0LXK6_9BACT|nr:MAG: hypothetical protein COV72_08865 [Candidatus Omnitrophica bacterium CG11_big_fil_rev_8_21_14_0_20_42_13]